MSKFTQAEKNEIVELHNNFRSKIALGRCLGNNRCYMPAASNMTKLVWCENLARNAQAVADRGVFAHSKTPNVGENIYWMRGFNASDAGRKACESWINEGLVDYRSSSGLSHATQVAWAATTKIGAGVLHNGRESLVFCMENVVGQKIYIPGNPGSNCPPGYAMDRSTGLCVRK